MLCCGMFVVYVVVDVGGVVGVVVIVVVLVLIHEGEVFLVRENLVIQFDQDVSVAGGVLIAIAHEALSAKWREQMQKICSPAQPLAVARKHREAPVAQVALCRV